MNASLDERGVAVRLTQRADALPVASPRWADVEPRLRRVRRARRRRRVAVSAGVFVSIATLGAGVQTGVLPYPSWAPAVVLPATGGPSALAEQPTKGSLARDGAWLASLRAHVAALREDESGGESWQVGDPDDVTVLFAGDVAGHRLAAVEAPYRWGLVEVRQQVWFMGPAGASAAEMTKNHNGDASDMAATQFGPGIGYGGPDGSASGWLVLTADDRPVTLVGPPEYAADGTVTRSERPLPATSPGVHIWTADGDVGMTSVRVAGFEETLYGGGWVAYVDPPAPLRGTPLPEDQVAGALSLLYNDAGLARDDAEPLVLWSGGPADRRSVVLTLRVPSGALVVGSGHQVTLPPGEHTAIELDTDSVLQAQPVDQVAWAWQQSETRWSTATGDAGRSGEPAPSEWVGLLGPDGATAAELLGARDAVLATTPLEDGGAVVQAPGAVAVRFLGAGGGVVATAEVVPWTAGVPGTPLWDR